VASLPKTSLVTYEEWLRMPEVQDAVEEVVDGEVRLMPPNKTNHSDIVENLRDAFGPQLDKRAFRIRISSFGLVIRMRPLTIRVPHLAIFEVATTVQQDGYIHSAPQLIAEVLSPANTRREREEKLADYASLGVPEVWVVSPEARTVEVLLLAESQFRRSAILAEGMLRPTLFPHVEIPVSQIWPD